MCKTNFYLGLTIDLDIKFVRKVALRELIWLTYFVTP